LISSQSVAHPNIASVSDGVNWAIAIPATVAGVATLGIARHALKLQSKGVNSIEQQLSATQRIATTLQKIEDRLKSLSAVIQAARILNDRNETDSSDNGAHHPPPRIPKLTEGDARIIEFIISTNENETSLVPIDSLPDVESQEDDIQSRYTSAEHVEESTNPNNSLNLLPLARNMRGQSATERILNNDRSSNVTRISSEPQPDSTRDFSTLCVVTLS